MLGHYFENPLGYQIKPIPVKDVDTANIYGHIFKLSIDRKLEAYEYREGPPINISEVDLSFFKELFGYLLDYNLIDVFGL